MVLLSVYNIAKFRLSVQHKQGRCVGGRAQKGRMRPAQKSSRRCRGWAAVRLVSPPATTMEQTMLQTIRTLCAKIRLELAGSVPHARKPNPCEGSCFMNALRSLPARAHRMVLVPLLFLTWSGCSKETVWFCPEDPCADNLIAELEAATASVHVAIAYFNNQDIAEALIRAHLRGVEVMVVGEASENVEGGINDEVVAELRAAGVAYRDDGNSYTMHNKFCIIDDWVVLTGSFNYTVSADQYNNENLVRLASPSMAESYEAEFQTLWAQGVE